MITYKRVCKFHKVVKKEVLVPCEVGLRPLEKQQEVRGNVKGFIARPTKGQTEEYCPMCAEEGTNYGIKTAMFVED